MKDKEKTVNLLDITAVFSELLIALGQPPGEGQHQQEPASPSGTEEELQPAELTPEKADSVDVTDWMVTCTDVTGANV